MIASIVLATKVADAKDDLEPAFGNQWCDLLKCHTLNASYVSRIHLHYNFFEK